MAQLIVTVQDDSHVFEIPEGKPVFVGRSNECDICLPVPTASRRHAVFMCRKGECGVKDMDSANGTYLNGKRIHNPKRLVHNDRLQIGGATLRFIATAEEKTRASRRGKQKSRDTIVFSKSEEADEQSLSAKQAPPPAKPAAPPAVPPARQAPAVPAATVAPAPPPVTVNAAPAKPPAPPVAVTPPAPAAAAAPAPAAATPTPPPPAEEPLSESATVQASSEEAVAESMASESPDRAVFRNNATTSMLSHDKPSAAKEHGETPAPRENQKLPARAADNGDDAAEDERVHSREAALNKAAAEAGLIGEFVPDVEEDANAARDEDRETPAPPPPEPAQPEPVDAGSGALPLDDALRQAIEARLMLYSFLDDMCQTRVDFLARNPKAPDAVKAELARQDREMEKIPNPDQAENMIEKRQAKKQELLARIKEAKEKGDPPPPKPPAEMAEAEDMAISQWRFCIQSGREALPAVWREAFRFAADEPLPEALTEAGIDPRPIMGGGIYCLALEALQAETKTLRQAVREQLAALPPPTEKKEGKGGLRLGLFGRSANRVEEEAEDGKSYEQLLEEDKRLANRTAWLNQEAAFMERTLIQEFWRLYAEVALIFVPRSPDMPLAVRAFLRHGVIGFKRWWMKDEVREHLLADCSTDVVPRMEISKNITNILYADEYLTAVLRRECTPALDENLEINGRNTPEWKADKAMRKLINSRSQRIRLEELLGTLGERAENLSREAAALDDRISKLLPGAKTYRQVKNELGQQRQSYKVEITKLANLETKIRNETMPLLMEVETETEARFASGELPDPTPEFLIRRECDSLHKIGRLLANLKERFLPLAVRESFQVNTDAVNDRPSILGSLAEMERRDPAIFMETLVSSKKKANRVDIRVSPVVVLIPSAGVLAYSWNPRSRPEDGRLAIPTFFIRRRIRERQITYLLADFRWDTSKAGAGMDVMTSDTIVAAFMTVRWDWRKRSKEGREKGLIFTEQNDRTNWRRVYEAYSQTAFDGGKKLYNRNYDFYERIIGAYFDLPEGATLLKK